jgi:hypothetical protein
MHDRICEGKNLSDAFSTQNVLKQGDDLSPLLLNSALEYSIGKAQENEEGSELNGANELFVYADDDNILDENGNTINK